MRGWMCWWKFTTCVELPIALEAGASIVGVNNRNLRTLAVDTEVSHAGRRADSRRGDRGGRERPEDGRRICAGCESAGYDAFLIGERFMTDERSRRARLATLLKGAADSEREQLFVKICGITRPQDAELASGLARPRSGSCSGRAARATSRQRRRGQSPQRVPPNVLKVGVFVDEPVEQVARIMDEAGWTSRSCTGTRARSIAGS